MAANNGLINITASVLPDDMRTHVSGDIEYDLNDGAGDDCKWISYAQDIDTSSEALIVADIGYLQGTAGNTTPTRTSASDNIEFIVIKHSGFRSDGTTKSRDNLYINFTHGVAAANATGNLTLEPGDVWWGRLAGTADTADFTAIAAANDIKVLVYAVLDDA
tara:strand:- start:2123 stop:2608 length:486 start_codon:yes stop_codon:yes gene_type:complete